VLKDISQYEALKTSPAQMMVGYFNAHFSLAGKMYEKQFDEMSKTYPKYSFFKVDVDEVPLAAYDAEVEEVPSIVCIPLGTKADGTEYDKTDMIVVKPELAKFNEVIPAAKAAVDSFKFADITVESRPAWKFDPSTGTTLPPSQIY